MSASPKATSVGLAEGKQEALWRRPEADALAEAEEIVRVATAEHKPSKRFLLYSGGDDSAVLLDVAHKWADAVVHINTTVGIPQANEHARRVGSSYGLPFIELRPPKSYEELCLTKWRGMPGPGAHLFTFTMLKERCVRQLLRDHQTKRGERFLLLTGARAQESERRMGNAEAVRRNGREVWVNPLQTWTNEEMRDYRRDHVLPRSEVSANLHMSGECMCGAFAAPGEREALRFFYPAFEAWLTSIEEECKAKGLPYTQWGEKRPGSDRVGTLCQGCELRQMSLFQSDEPLATASTKGAA